MPAYKLLSGETLKYSKPAPAVAEYLSRVRVAANDPDVSTGELIDLIYSGDNPLLETGIIPGRGVVTKDVQHHPVYQIMLDLLQQKRITEGELDREAAESQHTMTVPEAAEELGVSTSAVRQALYSDRIAGRKVDGQWRIYSESVEAYEVSRRGPSPSRPLQVSMGSVEGLSCRVKMPELLEDSEKEDSIRTGVLQKWRRVGVIIGGESAGPRDDRKGYTFWEIAPADEENSIEQGPFYVRGRFRVVRQVEHAREALDAYKQFEAK